MMTLSPRHHISRISEEVDEEDAAAFCTIFVTRILLCVIMFLLIGFLLWPHNISFGGWFVLHYH